MGFETPPPLNEQAPSNKQEISPEVGIKDVNSFEELIRIIYAKGGLEGTQKTYAPDELEDLINKVRYDGYNINIITRTDGLRDKVIELLGNKQEISPEVGIKDVNSFEELIRIIYAKGGLEGTQKTYAPDELEDLINKVRYDGYNINIITRTDGLRDKVIELLGK